jgi:3-phytase
MKYSIFLYINVFLLLTACKFNGQKATENELGFYKVYADRETQAVQSQDDAADDMCFWYNESNPAESRIIGTNKQHGLLVYNLEGEELYNYPVGRVNNVDIRYDFISGVDTFDIVGATNRTYNSISLFKIEEDAKLVTLSLDKIISKTEEVYGFCFYQSRKSGKLYGNLVSKSGIFEQYEIVVENNEIVGNLVRSFEVGSQCEGLVADDEFANLFIGEENEGIWEYNAEPVDEYSRVLVSDLSNENLKADIEGLTIYFADHKKGYLIVSSQGNNSYAVFNRSGSHEYLGSFLIPDGNKIDGTYDTDGIDVINLNMGNLYPDGLFVAQDGNNTDGENKLNQNFKLVSWTDIANAFEPNLIIDNGFDFR